MKKLTYGILMFFALFSLTVALVLLPRWFIPCNAPSLSSSRCSGTQVVFPKM